MKRVYVSEVVGLGFVILIFIFTIIISVRINNNHSEFEAHLVEYHGDYIKECGTVATGTGPGTAGTGIWVDVDHPLVYGHKSTIAYQPDTETEYISHYDTTLTITPIREKKIVIYLTPFEYSVIKDIINYMRTD